MITIVGKTYDVVGSVVTVSIELSGTLGSVDISGTYHAKFEFPKNFVDMTQQEKVEFANSIAELVKQTIKNQVLEVRLRKRRESIIPLVMDQILASIDLNA